MKHYITEIIIIAVIVGLLGWDIVAGKFGNKTESQVLRDWARNWTLLPFVAGFLSTHWFAPRLTADVSGWGFALPFFLFILGLDIVCKVSGMGAGAWWRWSFWYFLLGLPVGYFFWPQPGSWAPF